VDTKRAAYLSPKPRQQQILPQLASLPGKKFKLIKAKNKLPAWTAGMYVFSGLFLRGAQVSPGELVTNEFFAVQI
jgi:hypothetical protein